MLEIHSMRTVHCSGLWAGWGIFFIEVWGGNGIILMGKYFPIFLRDFIFSNIKS
jgi:hypothetical protein